MTLSDSSVESVTGITEARNNEAVLVEFLIESPQHDCHVAPLGGFFQGRKPFWRSEETHRRYFGGAFVKDVVDGLKQRTTGGQHGIENEDLPIREVLRETLCIDARLQRLLVAHHAQEAHLGARQQLGHALQHPEPSSEDGYDNGSWLRQLLARGGGHRGRDLVIFHPNVTGRLIGEEGDEL